MSAIASLLKTGIKALDDKAVIPGKSVPNALKKMGVKDEEVKFSGVLDDVDPTAKYSKENLEGIVAGRKDEFGVVQGSGDYNWVSLPDGVANPTYKENIYTFKQTDQEADSRFTSSHFRDVPNYLMHTRTYDTELNGQSTRVLQEIQSDLHQTGRQKGYGNGGVAPELSDVQDLLDQYSDAMRAVEGSSIFMTRDEGVASLSKTIEEMEAVGLNTQFLQETRDADAVELLQNSPVGMPPESPYEKSWLAKGIEREIDGMLSSGKSQLAIPIKGGQMQEQLQRADGPQKFYETQVLSTAKKLAKQNDMDFEVITKKGKVDYDNVPRELVREAIGKTPPSEAVADFVQVDAYDILDALANSSSSAEALEDLLGMNYRNVLDGNGTRLTSAQEQDLGVYFKGVLDRVESNIAEQGGEQYAVINPKYGEKQQLDLKALDGMSPEEQKEAVRNIGKRKVESNTNMKLYSSPAAAVGAGYLYLKDGNDPAGLATELEGMGYDEADVATIIADAQAVQQAVADGYDEQEALAYIQGQEQEIDEVVEAPSSDKSIFEYLDTKAEEHMYPATVATRMLVDPNAKLEPEELLSKLKIIQPNMASVSKRLSAYGGDRVSFDAVAKANKQTAQRIVDLFKDRGIDVEWHATPSKDLGFIDVMGGIGEYYSRDEEGNLKRLDEGFWSALQSERAELGWSFAGGVAGGKAGFEAASKVARNPWAVGAGTVAGSLLGAMGGSIIGTEIDYIRESVELSEDMSATIAAHKALTAAEASVIGDTIGLGIFGSAGYIWRGAKKIKDLLIDNNIEGAMDSMQTSLFVSRSEARDTAIGLQQVLVDPLPKGRKGDIAAVMATKPGSETIVSAAATLNPQTAAAVSKAIDSRARDVLASTAQLTEENAGRILVDDLSNYTHSVKKFYGDVKQQIAEAPGLNRFKWNYEKLAIQPALDALENNITDPAVLERFVLQASKIRAMQDGANLSDLIEVRQLVNDFKFNKRITKEKDFKALNDVLGRVDNAISFGAKRVLPNGDEWLQSYSKAKSQYAQMKTLEKNVIAKAVKRPGMTNDTLVKNLTKYITSLDGSFQDIMTAMPMTSRPGMEGAVIDALANKFADGLEDGMRVIHYPALSKELDKISFTTPEARKAKAAIQQMADVFKNDLNLANATGSFQLPKMQSYLTADPVMRAKYEFASTMFNYVKRLSPTQKSGNLALVMQTSKVLENPLNAKAMKELMDGVAGDVNLTKQAMLIQQNAAREVADGKVTPKVLFYGEGNVLSVKGKGKPVAIAKHRIATYEQQKQLADKYAIDYNDKKKLAVYLKQEGFAAMQQGSDSIKRIK